MRKRANAVREYLLLNMNGVIRFMILSDVVFNGAAGLLGPVFALFIEDFIIGGNAAVAGVAAGVYLITKSLAQIPAATIIDRIRGEKDDFWILVIGSLITSLIPIFYLFINTPLQLYAVQLVYGIAVAFTFPSYMAIFTRHIDHNKEGTEWGVYFTLNDLASAATASIGGVIATTVGFPALIVTVVVASLFGIFLLFPLRPYMRMSHAR